MRSSEGIDILLCFKLKFGVTDFRVAAAYTGLWLFVWRYCILNRRLIAKIINAINTADSKP